MDKYELWKDKIAKAMAVLFLLAVLCLCLVVGYGVTHTRIIDSETNVLRHYTLTSAKEVDSIDNQKLNKFFPGKRYYEITLVKKSTNAKFIFITPLQQSPNLYVNKEIKIVFSYILDYKGDVIYYINYPEESGTPVYVRLLLKE